MVTDKKSKRRSRRQFISDSDGRRTAVVLPIKEYEQLLKDSHHVAPSPKAHDDVSYKMKETGRRLVVTGDGVRPMTGDQLRDLRTRTGVSQLRLAPLIGISRSHLSRIENGTMKLMKPVQLAAVCILTHKPIQLTNREKRRKRIME